jgi:uncharacterized protein
MANRLRAGVAGALLLAAAMLAGPAPSAIAQTRGPAFDCTKASGEVEKLDVQGEVTRR